MTNLKPRKSNVSYNPSTFALDQLSTQTTEESPSASKIILNEIVADDKKANMAHY